VSDMITEAELKRQLAVINVAEDSYYQGIEEDFRELERLETQRIDKLKACKRPFKYIAMRKKYDRLAHRRRVARILLPRRFALNRALEHAHCWFEKRKIFISSASVRHFVRDTPKQIGKLISESVTCIPRMLHRLDLGRRLMDLLRRTNSVSKAEIRFIVNEVNVTDEDLRPLPSASYCGLQATTTLDLSLRTRIYYKGSPYPFTLDDDEEDIYIVSPHNMRKNLVDEASKGHVFREHIKLSANVLLSLNDNRLLYADKTRPEVKRMIVSNLAGSSFIQPGLFELMTTGEDPMVETADMVYDLSRKENNPTSMFEGVQPVHLK